jgi:predicted HTH domain antitoxin
MELPRTALTALRKEPASFVADMRIAAAVKWYELEMVSQAKAAEIAGLSRAEFLGALDRFGVSPFQNSLDELEQEESEWKAQHKAKVATRNVADFQGMGLKLIDPWAYTR